MCSGNICRSPMVEACLRRSLEHAGQGRVAVDSAGLLGIEGAPASREAVRAMREIGIDISGHRSRGIDEQDLRQADLVVAMTHEHLMQLAARFPQAPTRRVVLRSFETGPEADPDAPDLADPIGERIGVYRDQLEIIGRCVDHLARHLAHGGA